MRINVYGIAQAIGIFMMYHLFNYFFIDKFSNIKRHDWELILICGVFSGIIGGRLMCLLQNDIDLKNVHKIRQGGVSIFGAYYFSLLYLLFISHIYNVDTILLIECMMLSTCPHNIMVRIGNYFNNELGGKYSTFLKRRHPSQIYQLLSEGVLLNMILWSLYKSVGQGMIFIIMPTLYGIFRFICEFFKEEDPGMPYWFRYSLYKYMRFAQLQAICFPLVLSIVFIYLFGSRECCSIKTDICLCT